MEPVCGCGHQSALCPHLLSSQGPRVAPTLISVCEASLEISFRVHVPPCVSPGRACLLGDPGPFCSEIQNKVHLRVLTPCGQCCAAPVSTLATLAHPHCPTLCRQTETHRAKWSFHPFFQNMRTEWVFSTQAILFFSFIFISWRLITLQYCSGFCHTLTWISHGFTCIPHPDPALPPPSLPNPSGSSQCTRPRPEHLSHASNLGWWSVSP